MKVHKTQMHFRRNFYLLLLLCGCLQESKTENEGGTAEEAGTGNSGGAGGEQFIKLKVIGQVRVLTGEVCQIS